MAKGCDFATKEFDLLDDPIELTGAFTKVQYFANG